MSPDALTAFQPRKTPVQARAAVTVEAISEATIQVLLSHGADRLTTTRVAERAGVSVGTLYQYYPNKQSLLFAVLEDHLDKVSAVVEAACEGARHKPLPHMVREIVEAFVDAKMDHMDISVALYQISADIDGPRFADCEKISSCFVNPTWQSSRPGPCLSLLHREATEHLKKQPIAPSAEQHRVDALSDDRKDSPEEFLGSVPLQIHRPTSHDRDRATGARRLFGVVFHGAPALGALSFMTVVGWAAATF